MCVIYRAMLYFRLMEPQYEYLCKLPGRLVLSALQLLQDWKEIGMYDFCDLPLPMKKHLPQSAILHLNSTISKGWDRDYGMGLRVWHGTEAMAWGCGIAYCWVAFYFIETRNDAKLLSSSLTKCKQDIQNAVHKNTEVELRVIVYWTYLLCI